MELLAIVIGAAMALAAPGSASPVPAFSHIQRALVKLYGEQKGRAIKYAETFELNQYGGGATVDQLKGMFPTFSK